MSDIQTILVPDVGGDEVEIIEICVAIGDAVEAEDAIITVETDKASMDIPAPGAGTISALLVAIGDKLKEGDAIAKMSGGASVEAAPIAEAVAAPVVAPQEVTAAPAVPQVAPTIAASAIIDVEVPDIGEDGEVDVIEVLVAVGDVIAEEDGLITLETDKATMDVPTPAAGTVVEVLINAGDKVKQGSLVIRLETSSGAAAPVEVAQASVPTPPLAPAKAAPVGQKSPPVPHHPEAGKVNKGAIYTSPSIRRLAREFGVDLTLVKGTGNKARILKEDVPVSYTHLTLPTNREV